MHSSIQVFATGTSQATSGTSARFTVPNTSSSSVKPKYVRLAATAACYVKLGDSSVTAVAGDLLIQPGDAQVVAVNGATNIACIQVTAAGVLQASPVEDQ